MKKLISILFLATLFFGVYFYKDNIIDYIVQNYLIKQHLIIYKDNVYAKENSFKSYQKTDDLSPTSKEEILNIFYTALNGGWDEVTFFCSSEYDNCLDDVINLTEDKKGFSYINNLVHPYNSYKRLVLSYNTLGKIQIEIEHLYSFKEITELNNKIDTIIKEKIKTEMDTETKIKTIHDYIINTTTYDRESAEKILNGENVYNNVHKANGPLLEGSGICGGYSDAMALFLEKFDIENYKLTSPKHVWNYVYINNNWLHLDLTWDDPVTEPPRDLLLHSFFLINEEELQNLDSENHDYIK